ncbi:MAG TPA: cbb3-type cytochrome c oxidase subunit I [Burkholderiales bacterium]|nr:cbb3-type cytochrome c oxidase subunit I [Burkholderiales bacterium]
MKTAATCARPWTSAAVPAATYRYALSIPQGARRKLAVGWLTLGLVSLIASGVFSVLLVLSRAPYVKDVFPLVDFFHVALVVHVDLSVLVWFLAFAGVFWSLNSTPRFIGAGWAALTLAVTGATLMSLAPFVGRGNPVMSNYVPVLEDPFFLWGLGIFAAGFVVLVVRSMAAVPLVGMNLSGQGALRFGLNSALVSAAVAIFAFAWSWWAMPAGVESRTYYEILFWGGGHVIQFTYTLLMFVAWLWLATALDFRLPLSPRVSVLLFGIGLASVFLTPVVYLGHDVGSVQHHNFLTWIMRIGGGLAIAPFALALVIGMARSGAQAQREQALFGSLIASLAVFGVGGIIGFMIHGSNVKIPAHYHGCIVGVTLAFMGLTYHLLPQLGFAKPVGRLAAWQPYVYGGGQLLHILGLVWSGGYGVQRKVAGGAQALRSTEEIVAMGIMGFGGLVAAVGGLIFLIVVVRAIFAAHRGGST